MNLALPVMDDAKEYRAAMQQAARGFLQRHQAEHLVDDGHLFERATTHLVQTLDVPAFMAPSIVHLAMSELSEARAIQVEPQPSQDAATVVLVNRLTGERALIPRRILPLHFLATSATH